MDDVAQGCTTEMLHAFKHQAEAAAARRVGQAAESERMSPPRSFSDEELAILAAAAATPSGDIYVLSAAQIGEMVAVGDQHFYDPNDGAVSASHLEALESLQERSPKLARHEGGVLYKLTGSGFKLGRAILGR